MPPPRRGSPSTIVSFQGSSRLRVTLDVLGWSSTPTESPGPGPNSSTYPPPGRAIAAAAGRTSTLPPQCAGATEERPAARDRGLDFCHLLEHIALELMRGIGPPPRPARGSPAPTEPAPPVRSVSSSARTSGWGRPPCRCRRPRPPGLIQAGQAPAGSISLRRDGPAISWAGPQRPEPRGGLRPSRRSAPAPGGAALPPGGRFLVEESVHEPYFGETIFTGTRLAPALPPLPSAFPSETARLEWVEGPANLKHHNKLCRGFNPVAHRSASPLGDALRTHCCRPVSGRYGQVWLAERGYRPGFEACPSGPIRIPSVPPPGRKGFHRPGRSSSSHRRFRTGPGRCWKGHPDPARRKWLPGKDGRSRRGAPGSPGEGHDSRQSVAGEKERRCGSRCADLRGATSATQVLQAGALSRVMWRAQELRVPSEVGTFFPCPVSRVVPIVHSQVQNPTRVLPLVHVHGGDLREAIVGEAGDQRLAGKGLL